MPSKGINLGKSKVRRRRTNISDEQVKESKGLKGSSSRATGLSNLVMLVQGQSLRTKYSFINE